MINNCIVILCNYVHTFEAIPPSYKEYKVIQVIIISGTGVVPSPEHKFRKICLETFRPVLGHFLVVPSDVEKLIMSVRYSTGVTEITCLFKQYTI